MQKKILLGVILPLFLIIPVDAQENTESDLIPIWVKGVFGYWIEDKINDVDLIEALQFLIDSDIIKVGTNQIMSNNAELELNQKKDRINILENEKKLFELTESKLIEDVKKEQETSIALQTSLIKSQDEFNQYKKDYPLKIGNIGGKLVVDYINELEEEIKQLKK